MDEDFSRRVLLCMDAKAYSDRNDIEQHELQDVLVDVIKTAAEEAGLDRTQWGVQPTGDGELDVLPHDAAEWTVIDEFPATLAEALTVYNGGRRDDRLRMRLAIHQGLVRRAAGGYAGQGVVTVSRIVDSAPARQALNACLAADLVVLLSPSLFNEVVLQRHTRRLSDRDFRKVSISNKEFHDSAWLHVPGHNVHALQLDETAPDMIKKIASNGNPAVINNIQEVNGDYQVFGVQNIFSR